MMHPFFPKRNWKNSSCAIPSKCLPSDKRFSLLAKSLLNAAISAQSLLAIPVRPESR
jgi:hypothetical protein